MDICEEIGKIAEREKRASLMLQAETKYKRLSEELAKILETNDPEALALAMVESADYAIDGYVEYLLEGSSKSFIDSVAVDVSTEDLPTAREYVALMSLKENEKAFKTLIGRVFNSAIMRGDRSLKNLPAALLPKLKKKVTDLIVGQLDSKLAKARNVLRQAGATLADTPDVFAEIKAWKAKYDEEMHNPYVVMNYRDGEPSLVETDPFLADLVNYRYTAGPKVGGIMDKLGSSMLAINRVARTFETVFNPTSIQNQYFRDPANGLIMAGAYDFLGAVDRNLQTEFGVQLIEYVKQTSPEDWKEIERMATEQGVTTESLATQLVLSRGSANAVTLSHVMKEPYRSAERETRRSFWGQQADAAKKGAQKVIDALAKPAEAIGDVREVYVRKNVAANAIQKALRAGKTVEEALNAARFASANATTNYGRMLVHTENFRRTINYYGAAVNGFKSFWRMFELDPVGISMRLFTGILIPIIATTIYSLADEKNRQVYLSLREYEKENKLVVVIDGVLYQIPIPQEMNGITSMARHSVEALFNGNRHSFWELAMNDLLGFGPIDFSDMIDIDMNRFAADPTFLERLGGMGLSMVNQFAPVAVKSIIEAAFNIDTYTGKPIDTSYKQFDDEGNLIVVNPQSTGKFAQQLGELTGWSAPIISHTLKNMLGQVGLDVIETITGGQSPLTLLENAGEDLLSLRGSNYDRINQEWNANVSALWREKEQLLVEYNRYNAEINRTTDPEKLSKLRTERQNLIDPFLRKIQTAVQNLKTQYPGSYDRFRFAAVVSLLNFDTGTTTGDTAAQRAASLENYYENLNRSYQWMESMGISASDSTSLLGYLVRGADGETIVRYNTPTGILAARNAYYGRGEESTAEIQLLLDTADIKRNDMFGKQYEAAKTQGKATLKKYKDDWNARVVKTLAPYIQRIGVDNAMESSAVRDLLDNYLFIDNPYQTKQYLTKIFGGE